MADTDILMDMISDRKSDNWIAESRLVVYYSCCTLWVYI
jgi:hypothetical protein